MAPIYGESNLYVYADVKGPLNMVVVGSFSMIVIILLNMVVMSLIIMNVRVRSICVWSDQYECGMNMISSKVSCASQLSPTCCKQACRTLRIVWCKKS